MTPKNVQPSSKSGTLRPVRKIIKGASDTARLFIDIDASIRRTQAMRMSRYVE